MTDKEIMTDKETIKTMIELIISNIDEFNSKFVTYKAESMKRLLKDTLKYIKEKEQALDEIKVFVKGACDACKEFTPSKQSDINCRYCQSTQILNIFKKNKGENNEES